MVLEDTSPQPGHAIWYDIAVDEQLIGSMTNGFWSPRLKQRVGFALVSRKPTAGDVVTMHRNSNPVSGRLYELPFV